jgi:chorismate--pyruvate lyase
MRDGEVALIREVQLLCGDCPWVFARTLIPASSFRGKARRLARLRNKPLGALLFSDPTTVRENMQIARLCDNHLLHQHASAGLADKTKALWGRRTLFYYAQQPLLVNEIFLPDIPADRTSHQ